MQIWLPLLLVVALLAPTGHDRDRDRLLRDIDVLERHGVPGTVLVFGDDAFAVLTAGNRPEAMAAACRFGEGRAFAVAHNSYTSSGTVAQQDSSAARLFTNALQWTAGREGPVRVGLLGQDDRLAEVLREMDHAVIENADPRDAGSLDVLIWRGVETSDETFAAIRRYVREGGGLVCGVCPWGWEQINSRRGLNLRDHLPENRVISPMGLVFAQGYAEATDTGGFSVAKNRAAEVHAARAFESIVQGEADAGARSYLVEKAILTLPQDDALLRPRLAKDLSALDEEAAPTPARPLRTDRSIDRLRVSWLTRTWRELPVDQVPKATGADAFPGEVPPDAERVARRIRLDAEIRGWQGVGLYLPPGEPLEIRATEVEGWSVRIGCHTDRLWHRDRWKRWPEICQRVALTGGLTRVATPFGGTVYFEADRADRPLLRAQVSGAVSAPRYDLRDPVSTGRWRNSRKAPGPWTELEGRHIVLSVPSAVVRDWPDPAPLINWWDGVMKSHSTLAATRPPERRERFVPDVQISAGYMHSGYPIMCHLDVVTPREDGALPAMLDLDTLSTRGNWGFLHELGHNRQRSEWTFAGTSEVTCNLFSLYTSQTMAGIEPWEHPWLEGQKKAGRAYIEKGAPFDEWKSHPGIALLTYAQIQKRFGWRPFIQAFAVYESLPRGERPKNDQDRIDQWVTRMSHAVRRDLRPFFRKWGLPLGQKVMADESLDRLPEWLPDFNELGG